MRFDRNEFAGAFGDIGTDVPLPIGMALAAKLDGTSVLVMFGVMQILTGIGYRMPMPVQPLKAMAAIVIAQQASAATLYGAGLAIGVVMLLLATTGLLDWMTRVVPKSVVRGIQLDLGLQLASIALGKFVQSDGASGYALAGAAFLIMRQPPLSVPRPIAVYDMISTYDGASKVSLLTPELAKDAAWLIKRVEGCAPS